jgi:hypothetical protein
MVLDFLMVLLVPEDQEHQVALAHQLVQESQLHLRVQEDPENRLLQYLQQYLEYPQFLDYRMVLGDLVRLLGLGHQLLLKVL